MPNLKPVRVVLLSTYEMGRQPFGLASPAAWLRADGHHVVCADLSLEAFPQAAIEDAELVAFYLPMHTATRLAAQVISRVVAANPRTRIGAYGLYAPLNRKYLEDRGVTAIVGGEFEAGLAAIANGHSHTEAISLARLQFQIPDRSTLPQLDHYPKLVTGNGRRTVGYTEATRGCKHLCRHCPVVPVYNGVFRVVQSDVVLADIDRQVQAGAEHITFGDPDFFNGPTHATRIVDALHKAHPQLTYDVTIKVEHLLRHRDLLPVLQRTGCQFIVTAIESMDDEVLHHLDKGHTRANVVEAVALSRDAGVPLAPTLIPFTPWTTKQTYRALLDDLLNYDLVENIAPVQLSLRLLIPSNSRLLELPDIQAVIEGYDGTALVHRWRHPDPGLDEVAEAVLAAVNSGGKCNATRPEIFQAVYRIATGNPIAPLISARTTIPYLEEPWFC